MANLNFVLLALGLCCLASFSLALQDDDDASFEPPRVTQLQEVRVHTVPLSEAVHYANYMLIPAKQHQAARLVDSSASASHKSSSSSHKSSSSSSQMTESMQEAPPPTATVVLPPVGAPVGPDCVLQRLIVERPAHSALVVQVPSGASSSHSSSSSSYSSQLVQQAEAAPEPQAVMAPTVVYVKKMAPTYTARIVVPPVSSGHEQHFHSESRSQRQESHGGHGMSAMSASSSSSSSSSSSRRSSKSSTTTTTQQQMATLVAPPLPPPVQHVTVVHQPAPMVAVKAAPLLAVSKGRTNSYSVDVDHHYSSPNVKYGYSIKQQSSEPAEGTKGMLVGDRVVYFK